MSFGGDDVTVQLHPYPASSSSSVSLSLSLSHDVFFLPILSLAFSWLRIPLSLKQLPLFHPPPPLSRSLSTCHSLHLPDLLKHIIHAYIFFVEPRCLAACVLFFYSFTESVESIPVSPFTATSRSPPIESLCNSITMESILWSRNCKSKQKNDINQ